MGQAEAKRRERRVRARPLGSKKNLLEGNNREGGKRGRNLMGGGKCYPHSLRSQDKRGRRVHGKKKGEGDRAGKGSKE